MKQNFETTLKQPYSYVSPIIQIVEIGISQLICQSNPRTETDPEIDELP